jgi:hypothetical protein
MKGEQIVSIAINPTTNNYDYQNYLSDTQSNASSKQNTYKEIFNDLLNLSNEYAGGQTPQFLPSENFTPTTSKPDPTIDQEKTFLTNLQTKLGSTDSATSNLLEKLAATQLNVKNDLTGFNPSTATDGQVDHLFKQLTDTLASADPLLAANSLNSQNTSFPLAGVLDNNLNGTSSSLSVDDMKNLLTNFMDLLTSNSNDSDDLTSTSSSSTLDTSLLDQLSGLDTSSASDGQIQSIFSTIAQALQNSQVQGQDNTSLQQTSDDTGFPPILQTSGAALPPFNWKPSSTL